MAVSSSRSPVHPETSPVKQARRPSPSGSIHTKTEVARKKRPRPPQIDSSKQTEGHDDLSISQRRKEAKRKKLMHRKPEAEFVAQCNRLYAKLIDNREVSGDSDVQEKVQECIDFIYNFDTPKAEAFSGKARLLCVSRILRMCCKLGTNAQRLRIQELLEQDYLNLALTDSGHHLCRKLLKYPGNEKARERLLEKILIQSKLDFLFSRYGSKVVAAACDLFEPTSAKARRIFSTLVTRLCVPESVLRELRMAAGTAAASPADKEISSADHSSRGGPPQSAQSLFESLDDRRKAQVKEFAVGRATSACDKGLLHESYFHCAVLQLCAWLSPTEREELLHALQPHLTELMASPPGVRALCLLLDEADAKARKKFIAKWKEVGLAVKEVAFNPVSSTILLKLLHCVDDTRLLRESLLTPLLGLKGVKSVEAALPSKDLAKASEQVTLLARDKWARRILLSLLSCGAKTYFMTPKEHELVTSTSSKSKKEPEARRRELLEPLLLPVLKQVFLAATVEALRDDWICDRNARDVLVEYLKETSDTAVCSRVTEALEAHFAYIADHQTGQRTVVSLLRIGAPGQTDAGPSDAGKAEEGKGPRTLLRDKEASTLHERMLAMLAKDTALLTKIIETRGVFILVDLITIAHKVQLAEQEALRKVSGDVQAILASKGKNLKGAGIELLKNRLKTLH